MPTEEYNECVNLLSRTHIVGKSHCYTTNANLSENLSLITNLQSISKAWLSLPRTDTNWSMMPQGTPA